jgi:hypothetical protein
LVLKVLPSLLSYPRHYLMMELVKTLRSPSSQTPNRTREKNPPSAWWATGFSLLRLSYEWPLPTFERKRKVPRVVSSSLQKLSYHPGHLQFPQRLDCTSFLQDYAMGEVISHKSKLSPGHLQFCLRYLKHRLPTTHPLWAPVKSQIKVITPDTFNSAPVPITLWDPQWDINLFIPPDHPPLRERWEKKESSGKLTSLKT